MFSGKQRNIRKPLSQLEHVLMQVIWSAGSVTADRVREQLHGTRPMKDSTIRTMLRRLEEKGYVKHTVQGRTYVYSAAVRPKSVAMRAVRQIIDRFCGGSVEELLVGLVDSEVVDPDELKQLAERIASNKTNKE